MKITIFQYDDYKAVLKADIAANSDIRGYQTLLAKAAKIQKAYLSQVLNGSVHLTPDHAFSLTQYWRLDSYEEEYFLYLVHADRAAHSTLRQFNLEKAGRIKAKHREYFSRKLKADKVTNSEVEAVLFSRWYYSVVFLAIQMENVKTNPHALADRLRIPVESVEDALRALHDIGLVQKDVDAEWTPTDASLKFVPTTPLAHIWRTTWRQKVISMMNENRPFLMTKTTNFTFQEKDIEKAVAAADAFYKKMVDLSSDSKLSDSIVYIGLDLTRI